MTNLTAPIPERVLEPPEPPSRCVCGHDFDDHNEDGLTDDPTALLNTIKFALEKINGRRPIIEIERALQDALVICQVHGCDCRKFEPVDPHGDDRY